MSYQDFTNPVDIIAQTIKDLRTKPFWDTFTSDGGLYSFSGAQTKTIGSGTYEGVVLDGYMYLEGADLSTKLASIQILLDSVSIQSLLVDYLITQVGVKSGLLVDLMRWDLSDDYMVVRVSRPLHFNTSWEIKATSAAGASFDITTIFSMGKNT